MIRGTTPYIKFNISGTDLSDITDILVTIEQKGKELTKRGSDVHLNNDGTTGFWIRLTQEETLGFVKGSLSVQVKMINTNEDVVATKQFSLRVDEALYDEVISV